MTDKENDDSIKMSESKRSKKHHVLLLRHCVRSTKTQIHLYFEKKSEEVQSLATDYTASPLPDWEAYRDWCTHVGLRTVERSGMSFMKEKILNIHDLIRQEKHGVKKKTRIKFDIITDTAHRDVDTSLFFSLGISNVAEEFHKSVETIGLTKFRYDRFLFFPFTTIPNHHEIKDPELVSLRVQNEESTQSFPSKSQLEDNKDDLDQLHEQGYVPCNPNYNKSQCTENIKSRFNKVERPGELLKSLELIQRLGGIGKKGPLTSLVHPSQSSVSDLSLSRSNRELMGPINLLGLYAQIMFYSRASGIKPAFIPNATVEEVYQLLSWPTYTRSVLHVDNANSVMKGVFLADAMMKALRQKPLVTKSQKKSISAEYDEGDYDIKVTIFVGHDIDIGNLASNLGLRWNLAPPYVQFDEHLITPPGSGMHFSYDLDSGNVDMSYLYPVLVGGTGTKYKVNNSGILESVPMTFQGGESLSPLFSYEKSATTTTISPLEKNNNLSGVDALNLRLLSVMNQYDNVTECYTNLSKSSFFDSADHVTLFIPRPTFSLDLDLDSFINVYSLTAILIVFILTMKLYFGIKRKFLSIGKCPDLSQDELDSLCH